MPAHETPDPVYHVAHPAVQHHKAAIRHLELLDQVERAQADPITRNLRNMNVAATRGSWQASSWLLEHLAPERFGKAATELPVLLDILLAKLPPEVAGAVIAAWGILPV